jgi:hypothetical protein
MKQIKQQFSNPLRYSLCHVPSFLGASDISANTTNPSDVQDEVSFNLTSNHQINHSEGIFKLSHPQKMIDKTGIQYNIWNKTLSQHFLKINASLNTHFLFTNPLISEV